MALEPGSTVFSWKHLDFFAAVYKSDLITASMHYCSYCKKFFLSFFPSFLLSFFLSFFPSFFPSLFLSFLVWLPLPTHCRCRGLRFHLITVTRARQRTHTHTLSRTSLDEGSVRRRDLYLHNTQHLLETATIPASEQLQTYALHRAATGIDCEKFAEP
jgi:hypothetical protein